LLLYREQQRKIEEEKQQKSCDQEAEVADGSDHRYEELKASVA